MRIARFWMGAVMLIILATWIGAAFAPARDEVCDLLEGSVTYGGHPVEGGMIFFVPDSAPRSCARTARIDRDGCFRCGPGWIPPRTGTMAYRIVVIMDADRVRPSDLPAAEERGSVGPRRESARLAAMPERSGPIAGVVRASLETPVPEVSRRPASRPRGHRFSSVGTTNLKVRLGLEAATVRIALTD